MFTADSNYVRLNQDVSRFRDVFPQGALGFVVGVLESGRVEIVLDLAPFKMPLSATVIRMIEADGGTPHPYRTVVQLSVEPDVLASISDEEGLAAQSAEFADRATAIMQAKAEMKRRGFQ